MIARFDIAVRWLMAGIFVIAVLMGVGGVSALALHDGKVVSAMSVVQEHVAHGASSYTHHPMHHVMPDEYRGHRDGPSCWEHCADILTTIVHPISSRGVKAGAERFDRDALTLATVLSSAFFTSFVKNRRPPEPVAHVHRTGVSGLLRTSMRLRN